MLRIAQKTSSYLRSFIPAHNFFIHLFTKARQFDNLSTKYGILYKADPHQDPDLQKANPGSLEKADPIPNFTVGVKDSFLTNLRLLISNMTVVF